MCRRKICFWQDTSTGQLLVSLLFLCTEKTVWQHSSAHFMSFILSELQGNFIKQNFVQYLEVLYVKYSILGSAANLASLSLIFVLFLTTLVVANKLHINCTYTSLPHPRRKLWSYFEGQPSIYSALCCSSSSSSSFSLSIILIRLWHKIEQGSTEKKNHL